MLLRVSTLYLVISCVYCLRRELEAAAARRAVGRRSGSSTGTRASNIGEAAATLASSIANSRAGADGAVTETGAASGGAVGVAETGTGDELLALAVADVVGTSGVTDSKDGNGDCTECQ